MDRIGDGRAFHGLVAGRLGSQPRRVDWREARDLALVLTVAVAAPLAALAFRVDASPGAVLTLTSLTAVAVGGMVRVLRREYGLGWDLSVGPAAGASTRWRRAALRLIPARHRALTGSTSVRVSAHGPRGRSARPRRQGPGA